VRSYPKGSISLTRDPFSTRCPNLEELEREMEVASIRKYPDAERGSVHCCPIAAVVLKKRRSRLNIANDKLDRIMRALF
tara:strand:- start:220 stop:456 length:237 start_codon:yes stop_codon:yes gene_type:complete